MASAGPTHGGSGGRKSLDAEVNLVPFIDLLSMCICFLLMTAVWVEIGGVNVKQLVGTEAAASVDKSYELDIRYLDPQTLEVGLKQTGAKTLSYKVAAPTNEARLGRLREILGNFAGSVKTEGDVKRKLATAISMGRITTHAGVSYGEVVSVMDSLRDLGVVSLGLVPVRD